MNKLDFISKLIELGKRSKAKLCCHKTIMVHGEAYESSLIEPGEKTRTVKIAMVRTYCKDCDRTFKMTPMGIVYDPVKGINKKFEAQTFEAPEIVRKEVLSY